MPEYLIRAVDSHASVMIHRDRMPEVLNPRGYGAMEVAGEGDYRLWLGPVEAVFYAEELGWRVVLEGEFDEFPDEVCDEFVRLVALQLQEATGTSATSMRLA